MAQRRIIGGGFQDSLGNALSSGTMTLRLNQDALAGTTQVYAGTIMRVPLDVNGNISGTVNVWPNDQMNPSAVYIVKVLSSSGQLVWGPHQQTVPSGVGSYDLSNWTPSVPATQ